ncbi:MAG: 5'-nucleotidase C-terminal domain-containing protein, partial [Kiritimatiellae bacterium]|nr:5'-nucleotidase C-terminal domain-containing protein [Kiritimatiellia bacterium]
MSVYLRTMIHLSLLLPAFILSVPQVRAETTTVQILITTDTHGRFMPYDYSRNEPNDAGSLAQSASLIYLLRAQYLHNTIVVDDGDFAQGNFQDLFVNEANPMVAAMNEIGYDVVTLGNHEFNYGIPALNSLVKQFQQPDRVLCGNVFAPEGERLFPLSTVVTTSQGVTVGFIGTVSPNITRWDAAHLDGYRVTNPVEETREAAQTLRPRVDLLIALTHMDLYPEYETPGSGALELAEACPELDAIIGGHAHKDLPGDYYFEGTNYTGDAITEQIRREGLLFIESRKWADAIGRILFTLTRDKAGSWHIADRARDIQSTNLLIKTEERTIQPDADLLDILQPFHQRAVERAERVIGSLEGGPLVPPNEINGLYTARIQPTALITLINDVQMHAGKRLLPNRTVDASFSPAFVDQANLQPGPIRFADVALIYPYDNALYLLELTGTQLRRFLEWNAAYFNIWQPGDLTLSFNPERWGYSYNMPAGIHYGIDVAQPLGSRIQKLTRADGSPITDNETLVVAVNNHLANTLLLSHGPIFSEGESLPLLLARSDENEAMNALSIRELIVDYIENTCEGNLEA